MYFCTLCMLAVKVLGIRMLVWALACRQNLNVMCWLIYNRSAIIVTQRDGQAVNWQCFNMPDNFCMEKNIIPVRHEIAGTYRNVCPSNTRTYTLKRNVYILNFHSFIKKTICGHIQAVVDITPWARYIYSCLVLVQPRMTRPDLTEKLLTLMQIIKSNKQHTKGKHEHPRSRNDRGVHCMSCI